MDEKDKETVFITEWSQWFFNWLHQLNPFYILYEKVELFKKNNCRDALTCSLCVIAILAFLFFPTSAAVSGSLMYIVTIFCIFSRVFNVSMYQIIVILAGGLGISGK